MKLHALLALALIANNVLCNNEISESTQRRIAALSDQKKEQENTESEDLKKSLAAFYLISYRMVNPFITNFLLNKNDGMYARLGMTAALNFLAFIETNKCLNNQASMKELIKEAAKRAAGDAASSQISFACQTLMQTMIPDINKKGYWELLREGRFKHIGACLAAQYLESLPFKITG
jgi:hypothetical protein